jgi:hypothetical protein
MADYPISNVARRIVYTGSAGVGPYAFNFEVLANTDLNVYKNDVLLALTTNYTVTISPTLGTGSITLVVAATGADRITIVGARAIQRTTDFTTGGDFFANTLNDEMDSQTILVQQVAETAERSIKAPVTDPTSINMVLPNNTTRANKFLSFNASGNPQTIYAIGTYRGNWATGTAYVLQDVVKDTSNNNIYVCITAHTSTGTQPISSNADVAKWGLIVDAASATSSASAASSSASAASTSASNASASASTATTQASNASSSATAAAASYDSFDDRYLGSKSSNPTLDNDGNALLTGALYFNSVSSAMKVWSGSVWLDAYSLSTVNISSIRTTATAGQTVITGLNYTTGTNSLLVYVNGSKQISSVNYNETSSSSITFLTGLSVGDTVECLATAYQAPGGGAVTGVAATAPIASTGGTSPVISIPQATASVDGYLKATDFVTFNAKYATGGALGTPSSGTATNLTGTAAGLTAGNVTTNANLTGPITSVGNATSIASQTGTGSKFVVDTSPTITGATLTTAALNGTLGATTPSTVVATTISASTSVTTPVIQATSSAGGTLKNNSGTAQMQWGSGGGNNLSLEVATNINPANAAVAISPTGTGTVTINPATASTMNNVAIGGTTPLAGSFTTVKAATTVGVGAATPSASGAGITFPATQSASTDANTLDDYEEGTYDVALVPGTSGTITVNPAFNAAQYTKIGRLVTVSGQIQVQAVSLPVGTFVTLSLPFAISGALPELSGRFGGALNYKSTVVSYSAETGVSFIYVNITAATVAASDNFYFSFSYVA